MLPFDYNLKLALALEVIKCTKTLLLNSIYLSLVIP
jgi:hypothetical protein